MPEKTDDRSLSDRIVDLMFEDGAFEDNPLTEQILAERLGKGRSQIRDALNRLSADELIERRKKKGVYIAKPTPKVVAEIYDLRILMEGFAARQAVRTATVEEIDELRLHADAFDEAAKLPDFEALEQANLSFHETLVRLSRNDLLVRIIKRMRIIRKAFFYAYGLDPQRQAIGSPYTHGKIVDSLRNRDADSAETLVHHHIQVGKERVLEQALGFQMKRT